MMLKNDKEKSSSRVREKLSSGKKSPPGWQKKLRSVNLDEGVINMEKLFAMTLKRDL